MPWALAPGRVSVGTKWPLTQPRGRMRPKAGAFPSMVPVSLPNHYYSLAGINPISTIVSWIIDDAPPNATAAAVNVPLDLLVG